MPNIKLKSSDNEIFDIDIEIAKRSIVIKDMLEISHNDDDENIITLPGIKAHSLEKIIKWITYNANNNSVNNKQWNKEFLNIDQNALLELIMAVNYLDIDDLFELLCRTIADKIKGKKPEEIRDILGIENDLTKEEEDQILEENKLIIE